jgi:hypothetical protein
MRLRQSLTKERANCPCVLTTDALLSKLSEPPYSRLVGETENLPLDVAAGSQIFCHGYGTCRPQALFQAGESCCDKQL